MISHATNYTNSVINNLQLNYRLSEALKEYMKKNLFLIGSDKVISDATNYIFIHLIGADTVISHATNYIFNRWRQGDFSCHKLYFHTFNRC